MALVQVGEFIAAARVLLQDTAAGSYRYSDADITNALHMGLLEMRRLRPDLFIGRAVNQLNYTLTTDVVAIDNQYRTALLYYIVGWTSLRDAEEQTDPRAAALMSVFASQLVKGV